MQLCRLWKGERGPASALVICNSCLAHWIPPLPLFLLYKLLNPLHMCQAIQNLLSKYFAKLSMNLVQSKASGFVASPATVLGCPSNYFVWSFCMLSNVSVEDLTGRSSVTIKCGIFRAHIWQAFGFHVGLQISFGGENHPGRSCAASFMASESPKWSKNLGWSPSGKSPLMTRMYFYKKLHRE